MRPAWRLAINSLSERRSRTALLVTTVALSAGLIVAVACAMASLNKGIEARMLATVGAADLRVQHIGKKLFDAAYVQRIQAWPGVQLAVGRIQAPLTLKNLRTGGEPATIIGYGVTPEGEYKIRPQIMADGRPARAAGEIALDVPAAESLGAKLGDVLEVQRFGDPVRLTVVGVIKPPALGMLTRPESYVTMAQMEAINGEAGKVREIDVLMEKGRDAEAVQRAHKKEFEKGMLLYVTAKITSGLDKNLESSNIGLIIASALSFLSAAFIIMTGLTTNVTERERELAILRCIGGTRAQLAEAQLLVGAVVGGIGAVVGVPLGTAGAAAVIAMFRQELPSGFAMSWVGVVLALVGSIGSGIAGAAWPAIGSARVSPMTALAVRATPPRRRGIVLALVFGLLGTFIHFSIINWGRNATFTFWGDMTVGLPAVFTGYFLLGVPMTLLVVWVCEPLVTRVLVLPKGLLGRTVAATPYRHGFTAGAMMVGLALLIAIWTNGRSIMRDWLGNMEFPDAFVSGRNFTEATQRKIETIPGVKGTVAITLQRLQTDAFGAEGLLQDYSTTFIAFEPDRFFDMVDLKWEQGDQETARRELNKGGAVIVAKEFLVTRGLGMGDTLTLRSEGKPYQFRIVGVVISPGLDIVSKFFDIGEEYLEQSVNAVFGSRADLREKFGNDAINLIQISIDPKVSDAEVMKQVRKTVGFGILAAGSGREIKEEIRKFLSGTLLIFSVVAVASMLVACLGVANLIVAGIQARQFEFGVLRAIGAQRALLARLVMGEAVIIGLTACILGTVFGLQASWAGQRMYQVMIGLTLSLRLPLVATAAGWATVMAITLGAALPAVLQLMKKQPRELLGAMKG